MLLHPMNLVLILLVSGRARPHEVILHWAGLTVVSLAEMFRGMFHTPADSDVNLNRGHGPM